MNLLPSCMQACGSGGTTAGIALGNHLSRYGARIWAYGVCDDPDYFYDFIDGLYKDLGVPEGEYKSQLKYSCMACCNLETQRRGWVLGAATLHYCSWAASMTCSRRPWLCGAGVEARQLLTAVQAKGAGYAISQSDELQFMTRIAETTGKLLIGLVSAAGFSAADTAPQAHRQGN